MSSGKAHKPPVDEMTDDEVETEFNERMHEMEAHEAARPDLKLPLSRYADATEAPQQVQEVTVVAAGR